MSRLRVHCFGVSLDGFGAGPNQSLNDPLGVGGEDLHQWFFPTRAFQKMQGKGDGTTGVDNDFAERGFDPIILGSGESLFGGIDLLKLGYKCTEHVASPAALHAVLTKRAK